MLYQAFKNVITKIKEWSGWSAAGTIVLARLEMLTGLLIASMAAIDFSPFFALFGESAGYSWNQVASIGGIVFIKGVISEITRRHRATDL